MASTTFLLLAEFGTGIIPLEDIAEKYLGLSPRLANERAARRDLPLPAYRAGSQKSLWLVRVDDLAALLDERRNLACREWKALNG